MRSKGIAVALIALGFAWFSTPASAALITMNVTGGAGIDVGDICLSTNGCPTTPAFTLSASTPVTGTLVYDTVANTLSFTLVNSSAVNFGPSPFPALAAGQTFTGSAPVLALPLGGGALNLVSNGNGTATAPTGWSSPFTSVTNAPTVTSVNCSVGTGADQCGFALGPGGWTLTDGTNSYNVYLVLNVNTVPEPGTIAMVGMGLAGLVVAGRRRSV